MTGIELGERDHLSLAGGLRFEAPRGCGGDEEQVALAGEGDRDGQRAPGHIGRIEQSEVEDLEDSVRPPGRHSTAAVAIFPGWRVCHGLSLVGAVHVGPVEELVELVALACAKDFLERNDVGVESAKLTVDEAETSRITLIVLNVDRENSQLHITSRWQARDALTTRRTQVI